MVFYGVVLYTYMVYYDITIVQVGIFASNFIRLQTNLWPIIINRVIHNDQSLFIVFHVILE
jgi:hypothetical protein